MTSTEPMPQTALRDQVATLGRVDEACSPRAAASWLLLLLLFAAYGSLIAVFQGVQVILLPAALQAIAPATKVEVLGLLTTLSAATTVVALVVGGLVSDRTRSRWGKRAPSLAISCAASLVLLLLMATARSVAQLAWLMPALGFALNYYQAVLLAMLPDRIPDHQRGLASAAIALGVPAGIFLGVNIAAYAPGQVAGYLGLAALFLASTAALLLLAREPSSLDLPKVARATRASAAIADTFSSFRDRDFTLTFLARFVLFLAYFTVMGYLYYVVQDYLGLARLPQHNPSVAVSQVMSLATLGWILITPLTGLIADRLHRTRLFVGLSSIGIGLTMLLPALFSAWPAMLAFGGFMGVFFGLYMAVDFKLMAMVLPSRTTAGRDMGILSVASSGPIVLAPALAATIIALGGYRELFAFGGGAAILGGIFAFFVTRRD